jgi:hypothetical protein
MLAMFVGVMVPWTVGWFALWNRFADPWLRRRILKEPPMTTHVYTPHRYCEGVCQCGWPLEHPKHMEVIS